MNDSTTLVIHRENERLECQREWQECEGKMKGTFLGGVSPGFQRRHMGSMRPGVR